MEPETFCPPRPQRPWSPCVMCGLKVNETHTGFKYCGDCQESYINRLIAKGMQEGSFLDDINEMKIPGCEIILDADDVPSSSVKDETGGELVKELLSLRTTIPNVHRSVLPLLSLGNFKNVVNNRYNIKPDPDASMSTMLSPASSSSSSPSSTSLLSPSLLNESVNEHPMPSLIDIKPSPQVPEMSSTTSMFPSSKTASSSAPPMLPPCRVCGEKASGFHYGVNTCEACKGFFRRSLTRHSQYKCNNNRLCTVKPGKRSMCAFCRYNKCISVGMSKNAIKTGRYTHQKKTKDIQEVKRLQREQIEGKMESKAVEHEEKIQSTVDNLVQGFNQFSMCGPISYNDLEEKQKEYSEAYKLKKEMFGSLLAIPKEEYKKVYEATGLDVDGRRQMISGILSSIEKAITKLVKFAKCIPGFEELPLSDQTALIKYSRFEVWFISVHKSLNPDLEVFTNIAGKTFHVEELAKVWPLDFLKSVMKYSIKLKNLNLHHHELILMEAIAVMSRDRQPLECPEKVEESQSAMVEALNFLLHRNHPEMKCPLGAVMNIFTYLRDLSHWNQKVVEGLKCDWSDIVAPQLMYEMFNM